MTGAGRENSQVEVALLQDLDTLPLAETDQQTYEIAKLPPRSESEDHNYIRLVSSGEHQQQRSGRNGTRPPKIASHWSQSQSVGTSTNDVIDSET